MKTNSLFALYRLYWGHEARALGIDGHGRVALTGGRRHEDRLFYHPQSGLVAESLATGARPQLLLYQRATARCLMNRFRHDNSVELFLLSLTGRAWAPAGAEALRCRLDEVHREWCRLDTGPCAPGGLPLADLSLLSDSVAARPYSLTAFRLERSQGLWLTLRGPRVCGLRIGWDGAVLACGPGGRHFSPYRPDGAARRLWQRFGREAGDWIAAFREGREECL